jgi:peptidoglycan/LPS O-acetylase OafA/YrhL
MASGYRPDVDGLRAVAVTAVVIYHAFPDLLPGGFVGVDIFFVISGYLITGIIAPQIAADTFSFRDFYGRRARRLFPALMVVLVVTLLLGAVLLMPKPLSELAYHAVAAALFVPNLANWADVGYFNAAASTKPLLHLWSLGVEEQFYLVWPFLLMTAGLVRRRTTILVAVAGLSFVCSVVLTETNPSAAFYLPFSRLWELAIGGLLALMPIQPKWFYQPAGLVLVALSLFVISEETAFPGIAALLPAGGAMLVLAGSGGGLLAWRPLVWVGLISYGLYLWHWPLLTYANYLGIDTALNRAAIVLASVALASMTFRMVETPLRQMRSNGAGPILLSGGLAIVAAASVITWVGNGFPQRLPPEVNKIVASSSYDYRVGTQFGTCWLTDTPRFETSCNHSQILVWGDSFAALLGTGMPDPSVMATSSCPPFLGLAAGLCARNNDAVIAAVRSRPPGTVVLFAAWPNYALDWTQTRFVEQLSKSMLELKAAGVRDVVVVGTSPQWSENLPEILFRNWRISRQVAAEWPARELPYDEIDQHISHAAIASGARYVSPRNYLCAASMRCTTLTPEGYPIWYDSGHLSPEGAKYLWRAMLTSPKGLAPG